VSFLGVISDPSFLSHLWRDGPEDFGVFNGIDSNLFMLFFSPTHPQNMRLF